jgi:hypothetical protein
MTYRFKPGDHIRVSHIDGSSWQDRHGTVVDVIVRYENEPVQECAVSIDGDRRWFMARHLVRTVSPKLLRFFRSEALDRWTLDPDKAALLTGDRDQLLDILCEHCHFTIRRAQAEVEAFYDEFDRKTQTTIGITKIPELAHTPTAA